MISVVIEALNAEFLLVQTLAALVPAAAEGFVREVIVADAGSTDGTRVVADAAGCVVVDGGRMAALAIARSDWVLLVVPGVRLDPDWSREAAAFLQRLQRNGETGRAATFRHALDEFGFQARLVERFSGLLGLFKRPETILGPRKALIAGARLRSTQLRARAVTVRIVAGEV
jgi:glycosyltransferase involved in cell wall biosynthesis